ncbi:MAG: cupin domain-containing protein [Opitutaceae bacterium]
MRRFHPVRRVVASALLLVTLAAPARDNSAAEYNNAVRATPLLRTTTDVAGHPLAYPTGGAAEVTGLLVELPPGGETGWHKHTVPCFAYILSGEIAVAQKDGPTRTFRAGDAFAELVNTEHNGRTLGGEPVRLVFFAAGIQGQAFTVKTTAESATH